MMTYCITFCNVSTSKIVLISRKRCRFVIENSNMAVFHAINAFFSHHPH